MTRALVRLLLVALVAAAAAWIAREVGLIGGPDTLALSAVEGDVVRERGTEKTPGEVGMSLAPGDRLVTGDDGRATLASADGASVEVAPGTTLELATVQDGLVEVVVEDGRVRARAKGGGSLRVKAVGRTLQATDAVFGVAIDGGGLAVEAEAGRVRVDGVDGVDAVDAGARLHVFPDGGHALRPVSAEPLLDVAWPGPARSEAVTVVGTTEPGAVVQGVEPATAPVRADRDGRFALDVTLAEGRTQVTLLVRDAFGRERTARGTLERLAKAGAPSFRIELDYGAR